MTAFKTTFTDAIDTSVPKRGSKGTYDSEPNLPDGLPGRDGGELPEVSRDGTIGKVPNFKNAGESFKIV